MSEQYCPCGQQKSYVMCCQPLHEGQANANTAEQLMRSRYCAFVKQQIDYIIQTTALKQQIALDRQALLGWSQSTDWQALEVIHHQPKLDKSHASVEFKAYYDEGGAQKVHHELSYFVKYNAQWYFLDPTVEMKITLKQPCLCGSQQKFKHCCAHYL